MKVTTISAQEKREGEQGVRVEPSAHDSADAATPVSASTTG